ncbi:hypothetical protein OG824_31525 [Streptomyces prunicolor]|uniref:hypothetical protein n=1 Tax=Streptomyces prunicolor TaxID=67348 RepID=UPI00224F719B|nr:hypothetical protein [Streptomyces prunicolor]MCX5239740.1 hypothetical protein [Streptomyces prunicolor]
MTASTLTPGPTAGAAWEDGQAAVPEDLAVLAPQVRVDITEHLLGGRPPHMVARELCVAPSDVTDVLRSLGRAGTSLRRRLTIEQYFRSRTRHIHGGHLLWLDHVDHGLPVLHHNRHVHSARRIAWRMTHPTDPQGPVVPGCAMPLCVAPDHVIDHATLRQLARLLHHLFGDTHQ